MTRHYICHALLEGIAFHTAERVKEIANSEPSFGPISIDVGLSASAAFTTFLAQACQREIFISPVGERTAFGAAQLAAVALGATLHEPEEKATIMAPDPAIPVWHTRFDAALDRARAGAQAEWEFGGLLPVIACRQGLRRAQLVSRHRAGHTTPACLTPF